MTSWYGRSIRNKIAAVVLIAVVPALLLSSVLAAFREASQQQASFKAELTGIAAALAAAASEPLASGDTRQVANALKGIGAIPDVSHVDVRDIAGRIVFQFGSGIIVDSGAVTGGALSISARTMPIQADVRHGGAAIGKLLLIADASKIRDGLLRSLVTAIGSGLLAALIGIVASARMQRSVSRPLIDLKHAMTRVQQTKDFSHAVARTSDDETSHLVETFNDMMCEIRKRDEALSRHLDSLESTVKERTKELAVAVGEAQAANRAKSDFLATMSHEIRTPMNGMLVMAELLAASDLNPRAQRHCQVILRSGQTLLAIINDILDLSKIEAGKLELEAIPCDIEQIVDDVLKLFSERAFSKGLEIAAYIAPDVPKLIRADPVRLGQIVGNLLNNAIKFTETGGVLVTVERAAGDRLRVAVSDTGIGIPADKLPSIFDPFTQAEQSTTRRFGGTGIGLTICRKLVDAMGGALKAESTFGEGSTFSFDASFEAISQDAGATAHMQGDGVILTALRDGPVLNALSRLITDHGFRMVRPGEPVDPKQVRAAVYLAGQSAVLDGLAGWDDVPAIELTCLGQSAGATRSVKRSRDIVVEMPFLGSEVRDILNAVACGKDIKRPAVSSAAASLDAAPFKNVRALAADDSAINREVLMEALRRLGVEVTSVEDGAAAVEAVRGGSFDIVFMDGSMPILDGFDATRTIRAWEEASGRAPLPIVGLSAHVIGENAAAWRKCGMSDFVSKPFTLAAIHACLGRWVSKAAHETREALLAPAAFEESAACEVSDGLLDSAVMQSVLEMQPPGQDLVGRIIGLYGEHAPKLLERLLDCAHRPDDLSGLAAAAHALKSISRNVGALRVGDICGFIEDAARGGRFEVEQHRHALCDALPATVEALSLQWGVKACPEARDVSVGRASGELCPVVERNERLAG